MIVADAATTRSTWGDRRRVSTSPIVAPAPQFRPLRSDAYEALREAILLRRLRPGQRIVEAEIARQMGISRGPIREAVRQLEQEDLVEYHPRRGVVVARLTREAVAGHLCGPGGTRRLRRAPCRHPISDTQLAQLDSLIAAMRLQARRTGITRRCSIPTWSSIALSTAWPATGCCCGHGPALARMPGRCSAVSSCVAIPARAGGAPSADR